ncbi:hypothetical protein Leryth_025065 [Lithospermum erythrorhizon]|nr:hypothetical protein Leryth_025065 [Lithospermum erythrorhizon]
MKGNNKATSKKKVFGNSKPSFLVSIESNGVFKLYPCLQSSVSVESKYEVHVDSLLGSISYGWQISRTIMTFSLEFFLPTWQGKPLFIPWSSWMSIFHLVRDRISAPLVVRTKNTRVLSAISEVLPGRMPFEIFRRLGEPEEVPVLLSQAFFHF